MRNTEKSEYVTWVKRSLTNNKKMLGLIFLFALATCRCNRSPVASVPTVPNYAIVYIGTNQRMYAMDADGGNKRQIDTIDAQFPTSSPSGDKIAIYTQFNNPPGDVYLASFDNHSGAHKKLCSIRSSNGSTLFALSWSGDGIWLTSTKPSTQSGEYDVWKVDTSGTQLQQLTTNGVNENPVFSPDGNTISYTFGSGTNYVGYIMNSDGSNKRPIPYLPPGQAFNLQWSPDGNLVSFDGIHDSSGGSQSYSDVYVADVQGKNVRRITTDLQSHGAMWSHDGNKLAYRTGPAGHFDVCVINLDGTSQRQLTNSGKCLVADLEWSPDGKKIAYGYFISISAYTIHVVDVESGTDIDTGAQPWSYRFAWAPAVGKFK